MDSRLIFLHLDDFLLRCTVQYLQRIMDFPFLAFKGRENLAAMLEITRNVLSRKGVVS